MNVSPGHSRLSTAERVIAYPKGRKQVTVDLPEHFLVVLVRVLDLGGMDDIGDFLIAAVIVYHRHTLLRGLLDVRGGVCGGHGDGLVFFPFV